ncbi:hypothetical protein C7M61_004573 [Candidozyma pseudohaemuli]|uniref:Mitochondrial import inner membrane translocase subunit TIM23 n=1 Tax=Candidozyma pseudohaemuli TaxID=418784 RepID=A0A2P7YH87_9ASCO|nr:hypothetical protein C7M61_004573 [[Candida] pseudohaemulonii]PSK35328.1 hypothetical protein C7M61_004573 [[Candida] pseudohaemulonii]
MSWLLGSDNNLDRANSFVLLAAYADAARLHPQAGLDRGVEYLDLEDDKISDLEGAQGVIALRDWKDDLCYGTGTVYLLALGIGGAYGLQEGLSKMPPESPPRLKLNTVLNHITKRGPFLGNTAGCLAMGYNLVDAIIDNWRGKHDDLNSLAAGAISGAVFRLAAGLKPAMYLAGLMTAAAGAWCAVRRSLQ